MNFELGWAWLSEAELSEIHPIDFMKSYSVYILHIPITKLHPLCTHPSPSYDFSSFCRSYSSIFVCVSMPKYDLKANDQSSPPSWPCLAGLN